MYIYIYIYVWYVRIPYIYILPHLCTMQYFHIACCSRDKTSRTERLNCGNQRSRDLKTVRNGRHERLIVNVLLDTAANGECSVYL